MGRIDTFLEALEKVEQPDGLQTVIETLQDIYDVQNVVYHALNINDAPFAALTYSQEWMNHYQEQNYIRVDPVVKGVLQHFHPMDWQRLDWGSKGSRAFLGDAVDAGVGNQGLSVPIRGKRGQFALFTINNNSSDASWGKFASDYKRDMLLISHYLHEKATKLIDPKIEEPVPELSPRERDTLAYLAKGLTRGAVAEKMGISEHTLRVYIDVARHKLGALNATHAIVLAQQKLLFHV